LEDQDVDGNTIFKLISNYEGCGLDSPGSGQGPVAGSCKNVTELSVSIKYTELLDKLSGR